MPQQLMHDHTRQRQAFYNKTKGDRLLAGAIALVWDAPSVPRAIAGDYLRFWDGISTGEGRL